MHRPEPRTPLLFVERLTIETRGREMRDITAPVAKLLRENGAATGLVTIFVRHTSASLTIQENADPDVRADLLDALERLAPRDFPYRHDVEGPDDMPAHIKSAVTSTSLAVPVEAGSMLLGTWQGLYLVEHRDSPHRREVAVHFAGTSR